MFVKVYLINVAKVLPGFLAKQKQTKPVLLGGTSFLDPENGLTLSEL